LAEKMRGKALPTTQGKNTKKAYILEYCKNNPWSKASEVAHKIGTTPGYVWKILSKSRKPSKEIRGRDSRIFAHGKLFYEWWVTPSSINVLNAPIVNDRTCMKQIGLIENNDPCSCQIYPNGHLIIWPRGVGWREWLSEKLQVFGWNRELSKLVVEQITLNANVIEGGVKPGDPVFLPNDLFLKTDWGAVLVRDNTPENGVLELKLSVPDLKSYLGLPEIRKKLEVIEQGSVTHAQSQKTIEALLISLLRVLESHNQIPRDKGGGESLR
jgi:hypothetical protein